MNDFLQSVAQRYKENDRAREFVLDLLKLHVKTLLANDSGKEDELKEGARVQNEFKIFLHNFIQRNRLKNHLLQKMSGIMVCIYQYEYIQSISRYHVVLFVGHHDP